MDDDFFSSRFVHRDATRDPHITRIVCDHRERGAGVIRAFSEMNRVEVQVAHLAIGDYLVDDLFVFER